MESTFWTSENVSPLQLLQPKWSHPTWSFTVLAGRKKKEQNLRFQHGRRNFPSCSFCFNVKVAGCFWWFQLSFIPSASRFGENKTSETTWPSGGMKFHKHRVSPRLADLCWFVLIGLGGDFKTKKSPPYLGNDLKLMWRTFFKWVVQPPSTRGLLFLYKR